MFKYTARFLLRKGDNFTAAREEDNGFIAKDATVTVQANGLSEAIGLLTDATFLETEDDMNFQITKIEQA